MSDKFMQEAIKEALKAKKKKEVPVGAVIVKEGKIIARAHNKKEHKKNALLHAEVVALQKACKKLKSWRLLDCQLYVTLEPCPMCAGAIINSRLKALYFGAYDKKSGAVGSVINLLTNPEFNHHPEVRGGIMQKECAQILTSFFEERRTQNKVNKNTKAS